MKTFLCNKKGVIYVNVIFISLIIFLLLTSILVMLVNNNIIINSNNDSYRAAYIAESILELKTNEIILLCDGFINDYLLDLQNYKIAYIEIIDDNPAIQYNPPDFSNYMHENISLNINQLKESTNNPFEEYKDDHYLKVDIEYDSDEECINIKSMGRYKRARKFINVKLELPIIMESGVDENKLPKISILPIKVIEYYQTFDTITYK